MKLSRRIYALAECVAKGESVADIGTDHGYVPMLLARDGISPKVIMSDISADSLSKAVDTFREVGIECPENAFRVGDGLDGIEAGEVDDIIIAGLGGHTIISIIDADETKSRSFCKLILQPRKHSGNLRYYLYTHGYNIIDEILVPEGKFMCEIIVCEPGCEGRTTDIPEDSIEWKYPRAFAKLDNAFVEKRVGWKIASIDEELVNLKTSKHDRTALIARLKSDREYLSGILEENRNK